MFRHGRMYMFGCSLEQWPGYPGYLLDDISYPGKTGMKRIRPLKGSLFTSLVE